MTATRYRWAVAVIASTAASAVAGVGTVAAQTSCDDEWGRGDRDRFCEVREQTLPAARELRVDGGTNGGISVEGWDRDEIRMQAKVWANAESEARAESIVAEIRVVVESGRIRAEGPDTGRRESWGVGYALMVPRGTDLDLETTNGGISVAQVTGETRFRATNGGVHLEGLAGDVRGRTTNGGLHVALAGAAWQGQGLDVQTTNGGVTLEIPERYSAELETGTTNGTIDVDFPVTVQGRIGRKINAPLGAGGAPVKVVTTNGGVRVQRR
jgi:hypothetical protein